MSLVWCRTVILLYWLCWNLPCVHLACSSIRYGMLKSKKNIAPLARMQPITKQLSLQVYKVHMLGNCGLKLGLAGRVLGVHTTCRSAMYNPTPHSTLYFARCAQKHSLPWVAREVRYAGCAISQTKTSRPKFKLIHPLHMDNTSIYVAPADTSTHPHLLGSSSNPDGQKSFSWCL